MLYIGLSDFQEGRDPLGDVIAKHAAKHLPELKEKYNFEHCFLIMGTPKLGFHRCEDRKSVV